MNTIEEKTEALRASEERLCFLVDGVKDYAIFMLDPDGIVLTWNSGAERITGFRADEAIGENQDLYYLPEDIARGKPQRDLDHAVKCGRFEEEGWRVRKDGELFWSNGILTALLDDLGILRGFAKVTRDLTGRKRDDEALRSSEEQTRFLMEGGKDYAIFMLDPQGIVRTWNSGAELITGFNAEEAIGKNQDLCYPPEDIAEGKPQRELDQAAESGSLEEEGWRVRKNGERFWSNGILTALFDHVGKLRGFAKVTRDLTVRKQNDEALLASEERSRFLIDGVKDYAIFMLDPAGKILTWNSGAERITGFSVREAIGKNQDLYYPPEDIATAKPQRDLDQAAKLGSLEEEGWRVRKDGERFWSNGILTALYDGEQKLRGFAKVTRDLTVRKQNDEALCASEERSRFLIDGVKDYAIFMLDPQGIVLTWNSGAELITGFNAEEAIGKNQDLYYPLEDIAIAKPQRELDKAAKLGSLEEEGWRVRKNGERFWSNGILTALFDHVGKLRGFAKVTRDLTVRKQNDEALHASEERSRFLIDGVKDYAIFMLDPQGIVLTWNSGAELITGFNAEEAIGKNQDLYYPLEDIAMAKPQRELDQAAKLGSLEEEGWRVRKNGERFWSNGILTALYDDEQKLRGFAKVTRDLTVRRQNDEALLASEERSRFLIDGVKDYAIFMLDPQGIVLTWNSGAELITGFNAEEAIGKNQDLYYPAQDIADGKPQRELDQAAKLGSLEEEGWRIRKNGEPFWSNGILTALYGGEKQLRGFAKVTRDLTVQKNGGEALRASEEHSRFLIEGVKDYAIFMLDPSGIVLTWNSGAELITGFNAEEAIGRNQDLYYPAQDIADGKPQRELDQAAKLGSLEEEGWRVRKNGERFWSNGILTSLIDDTGKLRGFAKVTRDLTDRKQNDEALRDSEERSRYLIEGVKDYAIFMLDPAGIVMTWNSGAELIFGCTAEEAIGKSYTQFLCAEPGDGGERQCQAELKRAAAEGSLDVSGWRFRKDGSRFWSNGILTPLFSENGDIRGFAKITRDLSEPHRQERLFKSVLDHTLDSIICIDDGGTIETFNEAAERTFGYTQAEAIGQNVSLLLTEPYHSLPALDVALFLQNGVSSALGIWQEGVARRKDGTSFPVRYEVMDFQSEAELGGHFTGIVHDLTEQRVLEAKFHQSQKMEAFGQLAGGVAHDFNNLLTIIVGYGDLLADDTPVDDPRRTHLEQIRQAADRARSLTRQMLAFSRQQILEPQVLNLNALVTDTEKMLRRLIGEDVELVANLSPILARVKVDPGQIEQVIMNLAVNARDAMPQGGRLTIETQNVDLDETYARTHPEVVQGPFVLLAISDMGGGMTQEVKSRIFEPFYTTKAAGKGTGLGLAVVEGIVKQSKGSIEVYSEIGVGTTLKIYLPAVQESAPGLAPPTPSALRCGTETILLVEDEKPVRDLTSLALKRCGYTVIEAAGGASALALMESLPDGVDLLVTDVVMPEMSGAILAKILQAKYPGLRAIFLSGYMDDAVFRHGVLQNKVAFLQKPFTVASLGRKVREVLDGQPQDAAEDREAEGRMWQGFPDF